jgi:hypothetical protein
VGKTFRRDDNWDKSKEHSLRKEREKFKANRARKDTLEDETDASFGDTDSQDWKNSRYDPRF